MAKPNSERAFQNFFKGLIKADGGWVTQIHPGLSADSGLPDLMTAVDSIGIFPIEMKIGTIGKDNKTLVCSPVRPSQIRWHADLTSHGYLSAFVIGVPIGKSWDIYIVDGMSANKARDGFIIGQDAYKLDSKYITSELDSWATNNSYTFE